MRRTIKYRIIYISLIASLFGCNNKPKSGQPAEPLPFKSISLQTSDISEDDIQGMLKMDSYITLSNKVPLGELQRIIIEQERIFILDDEPKIICFDMHGKILFTINNKGQGPTEYRSIADFGINQVSGQLVVFDNYKMKLFFYNLKNGQFQSDLSLLNYIAPTEMGISGDAFFYKNIDHNRFAVQQQQMFYLLYSQNGRDVDKMFLPHDAVAEYGFDLRSFFYNENRLLFVKPFDNVVYQLLPGELHPLYEIHLPNPLPMKKIEEKMRHWDVANSAFAYGLNNIYQAGNVLYFTFAKDGWTTQAFVDVSSGRLLYCGRALQSAPREELLFISLIKGVYKGKFFSLISPETIIFRSRQCPELFPEGLRTMGNEDNGVIAFYTFDLNTPDSNNN